MFHVGVTMRNGNNQMLIKACLDSIGQDNVWTEAESHAGK